MKHKQTQARRGGGNTAGQHSFATLPSVQTPRSSFNRSCGLKTTFNAGELIPIFSDEVLPGDTMSMNLTVFARMATPLHPIMDNLHLDVFWFAVPNRLVWFNWERFMGEQDTPSSTTDFEVPQVTPPPDVAARTLSYWDYFGLPMAWDNATPTRVNALYFRALNLIWNDWFRDENLQNSVSNERDDGPDDWAHYDTILHRGKRHDYFTSCLPFPQKGDDVLLPLGDTAPVVGTTTNKPSFSTSGSGSNFFMQVNDDPLIGGFEQITTAGAQVAHQTFDVQWANPQLEADLSTATQVTINELRQSFQIQKLFERDARGGTRYTEILRSHFGVVSPDQRLQRPEFLGGGTTTINVNPVAQTSRSDAGESPQGNLAAYVTSANSFRGWIKSFTEHCVIIGLVSIRADLNYQESLNKQWTRTTRFDYYWPTLAHLGEQSVLNSELHVEGTVPLGSDDDVFGYQERYAEYRYKPSLITGQFRSSHATSLDTWHLAQDFATTTPSLNDAFIQDTPPIDRVIAVPTEPQFLFDAFFQYKSVRPMPTYSIPGLVDHF